MDVRPKRVTARRVQPLFMRLLRACPVESLSRLKTAISDGWSFDGKRYDTCVYGNLAKGAGYDFVDKTPEEIGAALREFGERIGVRIKADGHLDSLERFCAHAGRGDTLLTDRALEYIDGWLDIVLMEKGANPFVPVRAGEDVALGV